MKKIFSLIIVIGINSCLFANSLTEFYVDVALKNAVDSNFRKSKPQFTNYSNTLFIVPKNKKTNYTGWYIVLKGNQKLNYSMLNIKANFKESTEKKGAHIKNISIYQNNNKLDIQNIAPFSVFPQNLFPLSATLVGKEKGKFITILSFLTSKIVKQSKETYINNVCLGNYNNNMGIYHLYTVVNPNILQITCKDYVKK